MPAFPNLLLSTSGVSFLFRLRYSLLVGHWPFQGVTWWGWHRLVVERPLAYLLPAMLHVKAQPAELGEGPVVLVLAPTRELAMQIQMEAFRVGEILGVRDAVVYGGVSRRGQEQILRKGVDVLIATPGRLLDFLEARVTNLGRVSYLVVDEADRMLDMGFEPQLRRVVSQVRPERQTVMWSATWPANIRDLANDFCENMLKVAVGISAAKANPNIRQDIRVVTELDKKQRFFEWLQEVSPAPGCAATCTGVHRN